MIWGDFVLYCSVTLAGTGSLVSKQQSAFRPPSDMFIGMCDKCQSCCHSDEARLSGRCPLFAPRGRLLMFLVDGTDSAVLAELWTVTMNDKHFLHNTTLPCPLLVKSAVYA